MAPHLLFCSQWLLKLYFPFLCAFYQMWEGSDDGGLGAPIHDVDRKVRPTRSTCFRSEISKIEQLERALQDVKNLDSC